MSDEHPAVPHRAATGRIESVGGVPTLIIERRFEAAVDAVWGALVEPERLERWIGTWSGDPASGAIEFAMTAESPDAQPQPCRLLACELERALEIGPIAAGAPGWHLRVDLEPLDGGATRVRFAQPLDPAEFDAELAASIGPGWEYYLDRWREVAEGRDPSRVVWETYFPAQLDHYRAALGG